MKLSISRKVGLIISLSLLVSLSIMVSVLLSRENKAKLEATNTEVHNLSKVMINSISFAMAQGTTDVSPYIKKVKNTPNLFELRVLPANKIKSGSESKMDSQEQNVLRSKQSFSVTEEINDLPMFRSIEPILSDESCNSCHSSTTGEALATVSIRYSLANVYSDLASQRLIAILLAIGAILFAYFISMYFIKKNVVNDLNKSIEDIKILSDGDLAEFSKLNREDEIGNLNSSLIKLSETMALRADLGTQFAEGNFQDEVILLSEKDKLGKSFQTIKESLKKLARDAKAVSQSALLGNLDYRASTQEHKGEFKEIIENVNGTIDAVAKPIIDAGNVLQKIAKGDLTIRMTKEYLGDYSIIKTEVNNLAESFSNALFEVASAINSTAISGDQISSSTEQMAAGAQEQSSQTLEVASAVEEMTKTILETSRNSSNAADAIKNAGKIASEGGILMEDTISGMNRIEEVVSKSAVTVEALGDSSDQIGEIIQVIDDIADQTNLLALNAAIEAARAGEQGRGFAVVADEVRKLAERTTKATKEIAAMINQIQKETKGAVLSIKEGTNEVQKGKMLALKAGIALKEIIEGTNNVADMVTQVAAASEEQSSTAEQISRNVEAISNVTQESNIGIQGIAGATEELHRLTTNLQDLIARFKINSFETTAINKQLGKNKLQLQ